MINFRSNKFVICIYNAILYIYAIYVYIQYSSYDVLTVTIYNIYICNIYMYIYMHLYIYVCVCIQRCDSLWHTSRNSRNVLLCGILKKKSMDTNDIDFVFIYIKA